MNAQSYHYSAAEEYGLQYDTSTGLVRISRAGKNRHVPVGRVREMEVDEVAISPLAPPTPVAAVLPNTPAIAALRTAASKKAKR